MTLSRDQSLKLRGLCIISICLHNLLHLKSKVFECEFIFANANVEQLLAQRPINAWEVFDYTFSFWGWYGVCVFMFLSGYGLVMKHEVKGVALSPLMFILRNYVKLVLLMVIPLALTLAMIYHGKVFNASALEHITLTINLIDPSNISPGVYWYFGLTFQFYLFYIFFYFIRKKMWVYTVGLLSIVLVVYFEVREPLLLYYIRHNSFGWLMVFLFGLWYARGGHDNVTMKILSSHRMASIGLLSALWIYTSINSYLWVLSPIFFILACIVIIQKKQRPSLNQEDMKDSTPLSRVWHKIGCGISYLGVISAGIFAWHPIFRSCSYYAMEKGYDLRLLTPIYLVMSIFAAAIFTPFYKKMTRWTFKALHLR